MIFFDATKSGAASHRSGLTRVTRRLLEEMGSAAQPVSWPQWSGVEATANDWFLTPELFSAAERPGFERFLADRKFRCAAIFHDAIPLRFPHITWPQSVARHPAYMKMLARFDRVWAVSETSRQDLIGFWRWQGLTKTPPVDVLTLGADFNRAPRSSVTARGSSDEATPAKPDRKARGSGANPSLLCVGILEPRKNQLFLLEVCEALWREGLVFELHVVGRVNPHFGKPVVARIKALQKTVRGLYYHEAASDADMIALYESARCSAFPTIAEGNGLPLLESLWMGVPCVGSDLPVIRENADGGGCLLAEVGNREAWFVALRRAISDDALIERLRHEAAVRLLPTWSESASTLVRVLRG